MSSKKRNKRGRPIGSNRHISIRSARRTKADTHKYAGAVASWILAQTEADAQAHDMKTRLNLRTHLRRLSAEHGEDTGDG